MKLEGAKVVVVGMARSGVAAVELLREKGARVRAVDQKPATAGMRGVVEPQTEASFADAELIVLSPGVPADLAVLEARPAARRARDRRSGTGELVSCKARSSASPARTARPPPPRSPAISCKQSGIPAQVGGNIGTPPASMVKTSRAGQWNVLELSSFQLETTETFRAHIGAALNVTPDHLDRHYTLERYADAKGALVRRIRRAGDFAVLNADDPICRELRRARSTAPCLVQFDARGLAGRVPREAARSC